MDEGHSILDIVVVFLVPCHSGSLASMYVVYSRQRYKIYFETTSGGGYVIADIVSILQAKKIVGGRDAGYSYI